MHVKSKLDQRLEALSKDGYPVTLAELDKWYSIPDGNKNAADTLLEAFGRYYEWKPNYVKGLPFIGEANMPGRTEGFPTETKTLMEEYISDNNEAIELLHKGAAIEQCRYPVDFKQGFAVLLPYLSDIRHAMYTLKIEGICASENGEKQKAVDAVKANFGVAHSLENEPTLVSQLVKIAGDALGVQTVERILNRTDLTDAQLAEIDLILVKAQDSNGMIRAVAGECCTGVNAMKNIRSDQLGMLTGGGTPSLGSLSMGLYRAAGLTETDAVIFVDFMTKYMEVLQLEPYKRKNAAQAIEAELGKISRIHVLLHILMPALSRIIELDLRHIATLETGRVGCAIERYRLANGKLPQTLDDVVPAFLPRIPADPFDGKQLRYKRLDKGYVVYSVGEDGKDDGGKERPKKMQKPGMTYDMTFIVER